jgi:hypothetical protein
MKSFFIPLVFFVVLLKGSSAVAPLPASGVCNETCLRDHKDTNLADYVGIWYLQQYTPGLVKNSSKCGYVNATEVVGNTLVANFHFQDVK